jgi:glycosyltransferase involved in cell wall biosynthesis
VVLGRSPKGQLRLYRGATRLFATSTEVANRVTAESPALGERTRVIWNPIDYWNLHAAAAQRGDPITIGFIGRIHPEKGLELLLRAASRLAGRTDLPAWRLEITGPAGIREGGGGESWRDGLIARFGPALGSRLVFHPAEFDAAKLARRYGQIDIFCYPSLAEKGETFGVAAAEAMAAGAVPVASALACFKDLIQDGENGLIFNHLAADADVQLEHALARLLADSDLRHAMAARAQSQVRRFDYAEVSAAIQRALREMVR